MRDQRPRGPGRGPGARFGTERPRYRRDDETSALPPSNRPLPAPYPERPRPTFQELFRTAKPVIGVVHLKPLPGSPGYDGSFLALLDHALTDARAIEAGGASGLIVENFGDTPFFPDQVPPETIAAMTRLVTEVRKAVRIPVGVNVLRNDARGGVAVAAATGAGFVRVNVHTGVMVTDQGIIAGRAWESVRLREVLRSRTLLFADLRVKHAAPLAQFDLVAEAEDLIRRGHADALIITGASTGSMADLAQVKALKEAFPDVAVMVGSGVGVGNAEAMLELADGCIIGTSIKCDGLVENPVDPERVAAITRVANRLAPRTPTERPAAFERSPAPERAPAFESSPIPEHVPAFERPPAPERARAEERPRYVEPAPSPQPVATPEPKSSHVGGVQIWEPRPASAAPVTEPVGTAVEFEPVGVTVEPPPARPAAPVSSEAAPVPFGRSGHRKKRR